MNVCFPCFGRTHTADGEREPLLPKRHQQHNGLPAKTSSAKPDQQRSTVDRILDVLAAFNAGKLPTQDQLARFLQALLQSELLKEDEGTVVPGNGPMSGAGRKALGDVRALVQALLQFGLEKNADDILQQLYFQVGQIDAGASMETGVQSAALAARRAAAETNENLGHADGLDASIHDQVAFDAATFLHSVRTLCEICLKSPSFRLILADLFTIVQDVVTLAAADVERAARQVQEAAEDVQRQTQPTDDIIDKIASADDIKNAGSEALDKITDSAKQAPHGLKDDLTGLGEEASDKTKERILKRVQEVLSRVQRDPASKAALRAILILVRKYADKIVEASERSEEFVSNLSHQMQEDDSPNYPPQPYRDAPTKKVFIDEASDALLDNLKEVLQRLARGHSLDGLISAFGHVVRDIEAAPLVLNEEVQRILDEKAPDSPIISEPPSPLVAQQPGQLAPPAPPKKKGKKNKKTRMKEKKAAEKAAKLSPTASQSELTPSPSGQHTPARDTTHTNGPKNTLRSYFSALGACLDKALEEPGWALSSDGAKTLETIFDNGVELLNVVGGSVAEIGENAVQPEDTPRASESEEDKSRRQFKEDLKLLIDEIEAYLSAAQADKTTMSVLHTLSSLGDDMSALFSQGAREGARSLPRALSGLRGWTAWVGWALPRVMRMLPASAIPIPTVEVKSGDIEAALHAIFVQGLAHGASDAAATSLTPDTVVFTEWTEVRVDMGADAPRGGPGIQSTTRVRMHVDGVRARVEDVGYYFRHARAFLGYAYEDEGVLSIDVGMNDGRHAGLGADVELELESDSYLLAGSGVPDIVVHNASGTELDPDTAAPAAPPPLFNVVNVRVALEGLSFQISQSRHWILNTLVVQHLAGPTVARLVQQALETRIRVVLEGVARGLGVVAHDAQERAAKRRSASDSEDGQAPDGLLDRAVDWWRALLAVGPALFGRDAAAHRETDTIHETTTDTTTRGVIITDRTTVVEQPRGTPAMVHKPFTREDEVVDLTMGAPVVESEEETVVAVGDGAQLFPGKGGAYGATKQGDGRGVVDKLRDAGKQAAEGAIEGLREGAERVAGIEEHWRKQVQKEERHSQTWKSRAFDFE